MGYAQSYETSDEQRVVEGVSVRPSRKAMRRDIRKWVRHAKQVIERVPKFRDHRGERYLVGIDFKSPM